MNDCIFCKIAAGEISTNKLYDDELLAAFYDQDPQAPVHVLIVPKRHVGSVNALGGDDAALLGRMFEAARKLAEALGVANTGYRLVLNTGADGGQSVPHLHMHLLGGRTLGWPPG